MFMARPSIICVDLDHIEDILDMVRQPMVAVVARLAKAQTDDSKSGMLLAGNAVLGHGLAAGLS
jgi:hypothetical protein